jgi:DNA-binding MarR family transcriptional regulator
MNIEEIIEKLSQSMERYETETFENSPLSNLTPTQVHYLDAIFHLEDPKVSELASYLNVSKPTVTFALNKMEKQGFVTKTQSDDDRRFFSIHLTSKGKELAKLHDEIHKSYSDFFKQVLDEEELKTLESLLSKVLEEL